MYLSSMSFFESIRACFLNFADFKGRARRSEYWWFQLFLVILMIVFMAVDTMVLNYTLDDTFTPLLSVFEVLTFLPALSVTTRRLHDVGMSGWYQLPMWSLYLTYLEGIISPLSQKWFLLIWGAVFIYVLWLTLAKLTKDSHSDTNKYGVNPKL